MCTENRFKIPSIFSRVNKTVNPTIVSWTPEKLLVIGYYPHLAGLVQSAEFVYHFKIAKKCKRLFMVM